MKSEQSFPNSLSKNWKRKLKNSFVACDLLKYDENICGGEARIGDTRYRLSELLDFIQDLLDLQKSEMNKEFGIISRGKGFTTIKLNKS